MYDIPLSDSKMNVSDSLSDCPSVRLKVQILSLFVTVACFGMSMLTLNSSAEISGLFSLLHANNGKNMAITSHNKNCVVVLI